MAERYLLIEKKYKRVKPVRAQSPGCALEEAMPAECEFQTQGEQASAKTRPGRSSCSCAARRVAAMTRAGVSSLIEGNRVGGAELSAKIIDGLGVARALRAEIRARALELARCGVTPGLSVLLVGSDPASKLYVRNKTRACTDVGIRSQIIDFPDTADLAELIEQIEALNADSSVHGILVQLPLPRQIPLRPVLEAIAAEKDVDGFNLYNVGGLVIGDTIFPPCTPYGVLKLLQFENIPVKGQNATVVGASNIVGKPMALMFLEQEATVAVCHVRTRDLGEYTTRADILVVAAGHPNLIVANMVRPGAVVVDVGINRGSDGRFVGDVDFEAVRQKASYITPVPGGVGPMTVTMLLENTVVAAERLLAGPRASAARLLPAVEEPV